MSRANSRVSSSPSNPTHNTHGHTFPLRLISRPSWPKSPPPSPLPHTSSISLPFSLPPMLPPCSLNSQVLTARILTQSRCTSRQQAQATLRHQFQDEVNRVRKRGSSVVAQDQDLTLLFNCLDSIFFLINFLSDSLIRICLIQFCIH